MAPLWTIGADAQTPPEPGTGTAFAQAARVDPKAGGLSIGISFGQSTATHTNQVAKAVSTSTNMGVVGLTLGSQNCDGTPPTWAREGQPQPTTIDSRDPGAATWKREREKYSRDTNGFDAPEQAFLKQVRAASTPHGEAETVMMGGSNDPDAGEGNIKMGKAVTRTSSGLVSGVREARATAEIEYLELRNGTQYARFNGLRWDALHRSTGDKKVQGDFSIGWADLNGTVLSPALLGDEAAVLDRANEILKTAGLKLVPGRTRISEDRSSITIEPLALVVVPNATRDTAARTVFGSQTYKEQRSSLFNTILTTTVPDPQDPKRTVANGCRAGTYISVVDIVVGSVTGAGEFVLSLGGAEASTGEAFKNDFNLELGNSGFVGGIEIPEEPVVDSVYIGTTADLALGAVGGIGVAPTAPASSTPGTRLVQPASASGEGRPPFKGTRGGALAVVGLVTLGILAVVAEGDRRMLRAQRQIEAGP